MPQVAVTFFDGVFLVLEILEYAWICSVSNFQRFKPRVWIRMWSAQKQLRPRLCSASLWLFLRTWICSSKEDDYSNYVPCFWWSISDLWISLKYAGTCSVQSISKCMVTHRFSVLKNLGPALMFCYSLARSFELSMSRDIYQKHVVAIFMACLCSF